MKKIYEKPKIRYRLSVFDVLLESTVWESGTDKGGDDIYDDWED